MTAGVGMTSPVSGPLLSGWLLLIRRRALRLGGRGRRGRCGRGEPGLEWARPYILKFFCLPGRECPAGLGRSVARHVLRRRARPWVLRLLPGQRSRSSWVGASRVRPLEANSDFSWVMTGPSALQSTQPVCPEEEQNGRSVKLGKRHWLGSEVLGDLQRGRGLAGHA